MKQYFRTSTVNAEPMTKGGAFDAGLLRAGHIYTKDRNLPGYHIVQNNGYESWMASDAFENTYKAVDTAAPLAGQSLDFTAMMKALYEGYPITHTSWDGEAFIIRPMKPEDRPNIGDSLNDLPSNMRWYVDHPTPDKQGVFRVTVVNLKIGAVYGWVPSWQFVFDSNWKIFTT